MLEFPSCKCFRQRQYVEPMELEFHSEIQDTNCDGWIHLLELIEEAASDGRKGFAPLEEMNEEERSQIVTLPSTISNLKSVKRFYLVLNFLVRVPPEIGDMTSLEIFDIYKSYKLHWFPYEITRCKNLKSSRVSTRALYGNYKFRPSFPELQPHMNLTSALEPHDVPLEIRGANTITNCSVCNQPIVKSGLYQRWISLRVGTDVLPLLVNACSETCIQQLPVPANKYVQKTHKGGLHLKQPPTYWGARKN